MSMAMLFVFLPMVVIIIPVIAIMVTFTIAWNVNLVVPIFLHEIDRLAAGIVFVAMLTPFLRMARRYMKVERLLHHTHRDRLDHDRLRED